MAIDRSVVEKAAGLARIALTSDEVERFTGQLSVVLNWLSPALTRIENSCDAGPIMLAIARKPGPLRPGS